jgi:pseudouridine synthase
VGSRRAAEELIQQGRVEVNERTVTTLGTRVEPERDVVRLDGERLKPVSTDVVVLLHKPVGYLCSRNDPEKRPLIYALVPSELNLRSIGRLDFQTEGVLLLTSDGELAQRLGHPKFSVQRVYEARVRGVPTDETLARLVRGVRLEDGPARAEAAELVRQTEANGWVRLVMAEGRYREVRRMLERVGHPVMRLRRVSYAGLTCNGLKAGQWRVLDEAEVAQLRSRGHVGSFDLPPDPRRQAVAKQRPVRAEARQPSPPPTPRPKRAGPVAEAKSKRVNRAARPAPPSRSRRQP